MPEKPQVASGGNQNEELERWIDATVASGVDELVVAKRLAEITRPVYKGNETTFGPEISPDLVMDEGWLWPWNRAGFLYIDRGRPEAAATVFRCAYLAAIHFQAARQYRITKGMPLCNVAYAFVKANKPEEAHVPALLGMVEDAMTAGNPTETASFQNLIAANYPELLARTWGDYFVFLTRRRGTFSLYPETVLNCAMRGNLLPLGPLVDDLRSIAAELTPGTIKPALERLTRVWDDLRRISAAAIQWRGAEHGGLSGTITGPSFSGLFVPQPGAPAGGAA